ncbi:hypothetical protein WEH80_01275 [Actinomycetes bacterium KLBMP 9759]
MPTTMRTTCAPITGFEPCDRCRARAKVRAVLAAGGELYFCDHHARHHSVRLAEVAAELYPAETD